MMSDYQVTPNSITHQLLEYVLGWEFSTGELDDQPMAGRHSPVIPRRLTIQARHLPASYMQYMRMQSALSANSLGTMMTIHA